MLQDNAHAEPLDVAVVGAGAAGVGVGAALRVLGITNFALLDRQGVGATFDLWPEEMRFITPSFTSNAFGMTDLNAVVPETSPAYSLRREHPSGPEYADYLRSVAAHFDLPVARSVEVEGLEALPGGGFRLHTPGGTLRARTVVWATGEFQYPATAPFAGAELCLHSSRVGSYSGLVPPEGETIVIGGFESGMDAAVNLANQGGRVRVIEPDPVWDSREADPSRTLAPYTMERLDAALDTERVTLEEGAKVTSVDQTSNGSRGYVVHSADGHIWQTPVRPILANGFEGGLGRVSGFFEWDEQGAALLTADDESTLAPGLFLAGPEVRHGALIFCFIYKFRTRFPVIARAIGEGFGIDTESLEVYREHGMYLDDLDACSDECVC